MQQPLPPVESVLGIWADLVKFSKSRLWIELLRPRLTAKLQEGYNEFRNRIEGGYKNMERSIRIAERTMLINEIIKFIDHAEAKLDAKQKEKT